MKTKEKAFDEIAKEDNITMRTFFIVIHEQSLRTLNIWDSIDWDKPDFEYASNVLHSITNNADGKAVFSYCISAQGRKHIHMVVTFNKVKRLKAVASIYGKCHVEQMRGNKEQAEKYILKEGEAFEEKGEQVLYVSGDFSYIENNQGKRTDLEEIEQLIKDGFAPKEIMRIRFSYRKYEKMIKDAYYDKRSMETPKYRKVNVVWHFGETGTGKSYGVIQDTPEEHLYIYNDYDNGGMDGYNGEPVLLMDEFRGDIKYRILLNMLDGYKMQVHSRYANIMMLWNTVHITSPYAPDEVYKGIKETDTDSIKQLYRRINTVIYHYKKNGEFKQLELPMRSYKSREEMLSSINDGFIEVENQSTPFDIL